MPYYLSLPKDSSRERFFYVISFGPLNHIVKNVTLITVELVWVKFIFSCLLHKDFDLNSQEDFNKMVLDPDFGVYNRILSWAFTYARRNVSPPGGILLGVRWNYGTQARARNRDFFSYMSLARFIKDILDSENPNDFLHNAKKYSKGSISEVSNELLYLEEKLKYQVLGVNLSKFPVRSFLKDVFKYMKAEHFTTKREEFVFHFISLFIKRFRQTSEIEESGLIQQHMLQFYIDFIVRELNIFNRKDLLRNFKANNLSSVFPEPSNLLKPSNHSRFHGPLKI
jgi:hypothetical protein